ncbi:MAG: ABC transporter permease, partial [Pseudomonadota bacterium]
MSIARRELRGGLRGFRIFLACLALGVAAIAAVGSVRMAIQEGLTSEATALLGGDAEMQFTYRFATEAERAFMAETAQDVSETASFRSMAVHEGERALVQVKAVDSLYPLYGNVELADGGDLQARLAPGPGALPGIVAERVLVDRLGLAPGDQLTLGTQTFELRDTLEFAPDSATSGFGLGPQVIVHLDALDGSGLLAPGTLFDSAYRLRLADDTNIASVAQEAEDAFAETGLRWRDSRNGTPGIARFVDRLGAFLVLVGLAGLAVGGVGVSSAVRAYLE